MITIFTIVGSLLVVAVVILCILFAFLHKREENLAIKLAEAEAKGKANEDRITTIVGWCDILRENDNTLMDTLTLLRREEKKDFKHIKHEVLQKDKARE